MRLLFATTAVLALAGCDRREPPPPPEPTPEASPTQASIIRPEIEVERPEPELEPLEASVTFAEAGGDLSAAALEDLKTILESPQMAEGGAIVLRGHTDSTGDDEANLRVSGRRAEMVRDWLVEQGVAEERITVIALGEQRPIAPNAKLDGSPDEAGRAANRRVDVAIALPDAVADEAEEDEAAQSHATPQVH
ncbi:OmpA family protein [Altererythrobacter sp. C41]|uniref:OmpA family protein n=1 Tax=Altererythrobacter sp. C41 TaxID=2806021 RepID=UPI001933A01D|nr:OmpA family protein [Altererythrobacter sp. C41]MBM0171354.1 OmpA family protein [Altererythrobacter sp. C41]